MSNRIVPSVSCPHMFRHSSPGSQSRAWIFVSTLGVDIYKRTTRFCFRSVLTGLQRGLLYMHHPTLTTMVTVQRFGIVLAALDFSLWDSPPKSFGLPRCPEQSQNNKRLVSLGGVEGGNKNFKTEHIPFTIPSLKNK